MPLAFASSRVRFAYIGDYQEELTLEELWRMLRPALWPALLLALVVALFAYYFSARNPRVYRAVAKVLVVEDTGGRGLAGFSDRIPVLDPEAYREVARAHDLLAPLGLDDSDRGLKIRVVKGRRSSVLVLSVDGPNPSRAAEHANAWAEALVAWDNARARRHFERAEASLKARLAVVDQELARSAGSSDQTEALLRLKADLLRDLDMVRALKVSARGNLQVLEAAQPPLLPVAPRPKLVAALTGVLGFFLVVFLFFLRQALDPRLRSSEEAARLTELPVLVEFPRVPPGAGRTLSKEAANYLRAGLDRALAGPSPKVVVVTSAEEGAGKSSVALALARTYARTGRPVLLIDADLRRPVLDEELAAPGEPGLVSVIGDPDVPFEPHRVQPFLDFLPAGGTPENPSELLTEHWRTFLARVLDLGRYEVIVVDSPRFFPWPTPWWWFPMLPGPFWWPPKGERISVTCRLPTTF